MIPITRPTLLLHRPTCEANIGKMAEKAKKQNIQLIPHFKTHQSAQVGEWFRKVGVEAITVTSVKMANYFARNGWKDICIAFPVNVLESEQIDELAAQINLKIWGEPSKSKAISFRNEKSRLSQTHFFGDGLHMIRL